MDWDRNVVSARIRPHAGTASSAARPSCGRPIIASRCRATCCGSMRGRPSSGAMSWPRARACRTKETVLGTLAATAGELQRRPAGPRLALGRGHHQRSDRQRAPAAALRLAPAQRGLLHRRRADLARGRPDHPPGHRRREGARRFRQGLLRHARRRLGRADLRHSRMSSRALNGVYPYDWATFLDHPAARPPASPRRSRASRTAGYKLVWKDTPNPYDKARMDDAQGARPHLFARADARQGWQGHRRRRGTARRSMPGMVTARRSSRSTARPIDQDGSSARSPPPRTATRRSSCWSSAASSS